MRDFGGVVGSIMMAEKPHPVIGPSKGPGLGWEGGVVEGLSEFRGR